MSRRKHPAPYYVLVEAFTRMVLARTIAAHNWNVTHAARALGLQRTYLLRLLRERRMRRP